jgi:hypothetical protein
MHLVSESSIRGQHLYFINRSQSYPDYDSNDFEVIATKNSIVVAEGKNRLTKLFEYEVGGIIVFARLGEIIYYDNKGNYFYMLLDIDLDHNTKFSYNVRFNINIKPCDYILLNNSNNSLTLQSVDKKYLYLHRTSDGKLVFTKHYDKPVIFKSFYEYNNIIFGYDGSNIIQQTVTADYKIIDRYFSLPKKQNSIEKAFFQLSAYNMFNDYYDLYDGEYLWRVDINLESTYFISNPLKIDALEKGFNNCVYGYSDGSCIIKLVGKDLILEKIDDRIWKSIINDTYLLYGTRDELSYKLRLYYVSLRYKNDRQNISYQYIDVKLDDKDLLATEEISDSYWVVEGTRYNFKLKYILISDSKVYYMEVPLNLF